MTARTRSYAVQGALAYAPIVELLRSEALRPGLNTLGDTWLTEVARLLPELLETNPALPHPQPLTESWQRHRLFEALARATLAGGRPLLLVFDDLQWCDQETLAWLHYLLSFDAGAPLLVVGTIRTGETETDHPLNTLLLNLQRDDRLATIDLARLNPDETTMLAVQIAGQALDSDQVAQLYQDTAGNPLFVVETLRAQVSGAPKEATPLPGMIDPALSQLPPKVYGLIRSRLNQLSSQAQEMANLAATIGRAFTVDILVGTSQQDEEPLIESLEELLQRQIIREQDGEAYDFSHDRIRDVVYAELSRVRRRLLHRRVAEALEQTYANNLDEVSGLLARHYSQVGNREKAGHYFQRAGEHAAAQFAYADALRHFSQALDYLPEEDWQMRYQIGMAREKIYRLQSNPEERYQNILLLQEIVETYSDPAQPGRPQAEVSFYLAEYYSNLGQYTKAINLAQKAIELVRQCQASDLEAEVCLRLAHIYWAQGDLNSSRAHQKQAAKLAQANGQNELEVGALNFLAQTSYFSGATADEIYGYLERCLTICKANNNLVLQADIYNKLGYLPVGQGEGDYQEAKRNYEQGLRISRQIGAREKDIIILSNLGILFIQEGNYAQSNRYLEQALNFARKGNNRLREAVTLNYLGDDRLQQGDLAAARVHQEASLEIMAAIGHWHARAKVLSGLGLVHHYLEDDKSALACLQQGLEVAQELTDTRQEATVLIWQGDVLAGLGRLEEATSVYEQGLVLRRRLEQINRSMEALAGLARIALSQGDLSKVQETIEEILTHLASHTLDRTNEGLLVYLTCYRVLQAHGDPRAQEILSTAHKQLQARAATLKSEEQRRQFWRFPYNQEILRAIA